MAEQNVAIAYQSLSGHIYAGKVNLGHTVFLDGKRDVTYPAIEAVAEYVIDQFDGEMVLTDKKTGTRWEITAKKVRERKRKGGAS